MLRPIALKDLDKVDLVPQAILSRPISFFQSRGIMFVQGYDDLDAYLGAALSLNDELPFALKHYRGYPDDTTTVYLPGNVENVDEITRIVQRIVTALELSRDAISWQRADNPEF